MNAAPDPITLLRQKEETRSLFSVYRIVGDRAPDQCLFLAIETFWKGVAKAIGVQDAERVLLNAYSIADTNIVLRVSAPLLLSEDVAKVPQTFDEEGFRDEIDGIRWRSAGRESKAVRLRTIERIKAASPGDEQTKGSKSRPDGSLTDARRNRVIQRGAMQHVFVIPEGEDEATVVVEQVEALWKRLHDRKGRTNAESVTLRCYRISGRIGTICTIAPMHMSSEIAIAGEMLEVPGEGYVVDGAPWTEPTAEMQEARALGIAGGRTRMIERLRRGVRLNKDGSPRGGQDRFVSDGQENATIHIHGHEPFHFQRKRNRAAVDGPGTLIRLSVPRNEDERKDGFTPIVLALKARCGSAIERDPHGFSVVGALSQPSSTSIVMSVPQSSVARIEGLRGIRTTSFSLDDVGKLDLVSARTIATILGCGTGVPDDVRAGTSLRASGRGRGNPIVTALRDVHPSMLVVAIANIIVGLWTIVETMWHALGDRAFMAVDRLLVRDHVPAPVRLVAQPPSPTVWSLLHDVLQEDRERIEAARHRCEEFVRVGERLGDLRSSETSSSISGLVSRMASELTEVIAYGSRAEASKAAAGVLDTMERLARRAEDERARLVQGLTDRLETTRRFVDAKLDDQGLSSIPDEGSRA